MMAAVVGGAKAEAGTVMAEREARAESWGEIGSRVHEGSGAMVEDMGMGAAAMVAAMVAPMEGLRVAWTVVSRVA